MATCRQCGKSIGMFAFECQDCISKNAAAAKALLERGEDDDSSDAPSSPTKIAALSRIILTTESTSSLIITDRLGIVSAECVLGMNVFKDLGAGLRDIFGGRSAGYQNALREARMTVLDELRHQACDLGADAVVAISLDYSEISGGGKSMLFLVATGTAVKLADVPLSV